MADRQDIDALLMGAVYGELDAAERARLDAHLSSHPEDRAELQSLERTRAQVRRSIAELPDAEPSPSGLSALLEAARGALLPEAKAAVEPESEGGLWARFVAWLVPTTRHPAFAAMAVLVLVAGVAGAWYLSGGKVAEPEVASNDRPTQSAVIGGAGSGSASASGSAVAAATPADTSNGYRVDLDESARAAAENQANQAQQAAQVPQQANTNAARDQRFADKTPAAPKASASGKGGGAAPAMHKANGTDPGYMNVQPDGDKLDIKSEDDQQKNDNGLAGGETINAGVGTAAGAAAPEPAPPPPTAANNEPMDPQLLDWAKGQHAYLVKLVQQGKCPEAGRVGAAIKDKAPEYFSQYVATDRAVRQCLQYIQGDAKKKAAKDYKSRSQTNSGDAESPADLNN